uniref:Uncharacterized protein n=1 Tax=Lepeophtheirus salmonis TaxID=72036 RepID=A0A0K2UNL7_LEPSM
MYGVSPSLLATNSSKRSTILIQVIFDRGESFNLVSTLWCLRVNEVINLSLLEGSTVAVVTLGPGWTSETVPFLLFPDVIEAATTASSSGINESRSTPLAASSNNFRSSGSGWSGAEVDTTALSSLVGSLPCGRSPIIRFITLILSNKSKLSVLTS